MTGWHHQEKGEWGNSPFAILLIALPDFVTVVVGCHSLNNFDSLV
jgi:hypothetical protein